MRVVLVLSFLFWIHGIAPAQESRCADCHFANPKAPAQNHVSDWEHSAHGRHNVGCEKCHGGDPSTFEPFPAHQGILDGGNPASPVHRRNLPRTCGACHIGPYAAFQRSHHYEMLRAGQDEGPTCSTCHGEVAARLLSPKGLAGQCARCHDSGKTAPRPDYPPQGKLMQEGIRDVRVLLDEAKGQIRRIKDPARRQELETIYRQAEVPLIEAVNSGHAFVFDQLQERLAVARERSEALVELLANPPPR